MLGAHKLAALLPPRFAAGHLLALLTLGMSLLATLLVLGSSLGWNGGKHITGVLLRLHIIHGHGCHGLRAMTLP